MSERLDRDAWLDAGLATLAEAGPAAIKIPAIAKRLGVTKGSFYWHFRDLGSYEDALLAAWERRDTRDVVRDLEASGTPAVERLRALLERAFAADNRLARSIRHWSAGDARARRARTRVDRERLAYIAGLLREIGWSAHDAAALARWHYWAVIGLHASGSRRPQNGASEIELVLRTLQPRGQ